MFRFLGIVALMTGVATAGIVLEKRALEIRRLNTRQHFRLEVLRDRRAELQMQTQQLSGARRLTGPLREGLIAPRPQPTGSQPLALPLPELRIPVRDRASSR
ncbi:hypothetical protein [Stratiformator vulcanicus]|uniref:Cell division protein FtsL n=1 Tax=Stratiformator vulcanicus TaxID=2527980 RepID=A0A517R2C1_9PLAN|nr:hypothetical protein [Stratiformator vulcanicus]QDT38026.1 hypothetical protein Pan189_24100 [Stratiformator vulcanicus]